MAETTETIPTLEALEAPAAVAEPIPSEEPEVAPMGVISSLETAPKEATTAESLHSTPEIAESKPQEADLVEDNEPAPSLPIRRATVDIPEEVEAPKASQENPALISTFSNQSRKALLELQSTFISYRTFSWEFLREIPLVPSRRRRARAALRSYWDWMQQEKMKALALSEGELKATLLRLTELVEHQFPSFRNDAKAWVWDGWRKTALLLIAAVTTLVGFGVGIPATVPIVAAYFHPAEVIAEVPAAPPETPASEAALDPTRDLAHLLLSCESSSVGKIKRIKLYSADGKEVAQFPAQVSKIKRAALTPLPAGDYGVVLESVQGPVVGSLTINAGQRRYVDLSKWTETGANALVSITSSPSGKVVICDGAIVGQAPLKARMVIGIHKLRLNILGFSGEEQHVMISDDEEQKIALSVTTSRMVFLLPTQDPARNIRIFVNGSLVISPQSHVVLSGQQHVAIYDGDMLVGQQQINVDPGEEARMKIISMIGGGLALTGPVRETATP